MTISVLIELLLFELLLFLFLWMMMMVQMSWLSSVEEFAVVWVVPFWKIVSPSIVLTRPFFRILPHPPTRYAVEVLQNRIDTHQ
jgi:hypothetical protein